MADVAFLAKLPKSTLSRLWDEEDWLDRVTGHSLKQLVSVLPGLVAHLNRQSCGPRLRDAVRNCAEEGLQVRMERVNALLSTGCAAQRIILVLETAVAIMRLDARESVSYLARCWGTGQDLALDPLLAPASSLKALLTDSAPLLEKAARLLVRLEGARGSSLQAMVGHGILVHKTTKLTGEDRVLDSLGTTRQDAFAYRSATIGLLLSVGDLDLAEDYVRSLEQSPLLRKNELWSFATYSKDVAQVPGLEVPRASTLPKTAALIVKDASEFNEAYLYYLASAAIPTLLGHDPTFGSHRTQLVDSLRDRLEIGLSGAAADSCAALVKSLID